MFGNIVEYAENVRLIAAPIHALEHFVFGVLKRHVEIGNDFAALTEPLD